MPDMEVWDWILFAGAAYVAITSLVILMRRRRDEVLAQLDAQAQLERQKQQERARHERRQQKTKQAA